MGDPMRIRATLIGKVVEVKVLMAHEMETGQRKDSRGQIIAARFISRVSATYRGTVVMSAQWGPAVSKNPFLEFRFEGGEAGETVQIAWTDTAGDSRVDEVTIQ